MKFFTRQELDYLDAAKNAPKTNRARFDYLRHFGMVDRATRNALPDLFAEPDSDEQKKFRIGAMTCRMTDQQAEDWNTGNATAWTMAGALVFLPSRSGASSFVRDGEVIVNDGLPTGEFVDLWVFIHTNEADYSEFMEDEMAVAD